LGKRGLLPWIKEGMVQLWGKTGMEKDRKGGGRRRRGYKGSGHKRVHKNSRWEGCPAFLEPKRQGVGQKKNPGKKAPNWRQRESSPAKGKDLGKGKGLSLGALKQEES